jgi:tripartite ATP-independent transporter DctM subunit
VSQHTLLDITAADDIPRGGLLGAAQALLSGVNAAMAVASSLAILLAASVLTWAVFARYKLGMASDWQDELSTFLLIGATFASAAWTQARRGHVAIDALAHILPPRVDRARRLAVAGRGLGGGADHPLRLGAAAVDPLWLHDRGDGPALAADPAAVACGPNPRHRGTASAMSVLAIGLLYGGATIVALFSGIPIAFALGGVATVFMFLFMPAASLDTIAQNVYEELASITLLTIPLFILKGAAIGKSRAGKDLYDALHAWLNRVPGGLGVAVVIACGLFAAMAGSSPATCSAIGSSGIPEMRRRGYSPGFAAGLVAAGGTLGILLPPSIVLILYAVAAEQSLGRLFLAGLGPGVLLVILFAGYAMMHWRAEHALALRLAEAGGARGEILRADHATMRERLIALPRILPFLVLLTGVMLVLYGGYATPSETAGVGAVLALVLVAIVYQAWRLSDLKPIFIGTLGESGMLLMIIGMSLLYSYVMSYLHISQGAAQWIVGLHLSRWLLLLAILLMVVVLGFFLPPVSIILMTAPIILPPLRAAGFDLIWFGVVMAVVMEMGLIHPPVGLNIFVINRIAPDIGLGAIIRGTLPFVVLMAIAVVILSLIPGIALWLPTAVYG